MNKIEVGNEIFDEFFAEFTKQELRVLEIILRDGGISRLTALHYGISNVTAVVSDLRDKLIRDNYRILCIKKQDKDSRDYSSWVLSDNLAIRLEGENFLKLAA